MTISEALGVGARQLSSHSNSARLDAEVLLAHLVGQNRSWLLAHGGDALQKELEEQFSHFLSRRERGEPVAYLTASREFYGLYLRVTRDVLVPRPETESVVDACLEYLPQSEMSQMADIGTGSGAIVTAVCCHRPLVRAFATEISEPALRVATQNARLHKVEDQITFLLGDLLEPLPHAVSLIAANLPYVSPGEAADDVATWEPQVAVFGGDEDGSALIRRFLKSAPRYLLPGGRIVMETAYSQGRLVSGLAAEAFPGASIDVRKDLAGYDRIVVIQT